LGWAPDANPAETAAVTELLLAEMRCGTSLYWAIRVREEKQADTSIDLLTIMDPRLGTEEFSILTSKAEEFEVHNSIRRHAAESLGKLELIVGLMEYSRATPICADPAQRFEAYLHLRDVTFLRDLLNLLEMPEMKSGPAATCLAQAA
jgi:hypothetical protein